MAGGPAPIPNKLTPSERETLVRRTRRRLGPQAQALRARIVLACAEPGAPNTDVARALGISRPTVITWRRRGTFRSTHALEQAIRRYIDATNAEPKPFVWTRSADEILDNLKRFRQRTSASDH